MFNKLELSWAKLSQSWGNLKFCIFLILLNYGSGYEDDMQNNNG